MKEFFIVAAFLFVLWNIVPAEIEKRIGDGGIYYSENGGETWEQMAVMENRFLITSLDVLSLAVHPDDAEILYLGSKGGGLYKSYSRGKYWHQITGEGEELSDGADIYDIAIDSENPDRIYLAVGQNKRGRVLRSEDGGGSWEEVYIIADKKQIVSEIAIDNYDSSVIYIKTSEGEFLKSADYGKTWQIVKWFEDAISKIAINPEAELVLSNASQLFYKADSVLYRSLDGGENWTIRQLPTSRKIKEIVIDPQNPNLIYAGVSK
ncbi:hypothetical protein KKG85_00180 [Patescibacteria group bacterium]|nr:hypothetical protein [Patescibacteria group bacterium]MBU2579399.1 hypothetical protein [Patescibacteria group bacterium]